LRPIPWPSTKVRRASINSFGFGGTNAHVVLDDAHSFLSAHNLQGLHRTVSESPSEGFEPHELGLQEDAALPNRTTTATQHTNGIAGGAYDVTNHPSNHEAKRIFIFSSLDQAGIKRTVEAYSEYLLSKSSSNENNYIDDLAYTLAKKRTLFPWKSFVVAGSLPELIERLPDAPRIAKHTRKATIPKLGFVFTGQGAQWHGMGRELLVYPIFRRSLEDASNYFDQLNSPWHLLGEFAYGEVPFISKDLIIVDSKQMNYSRRNLSPELILLLSAKLLVQLFK
jgi:acyl transferase domain-containing protein